MAQFGDAEGILGLPHRHPLVRWLTPPTPIGNAIDRYLQDDLGDHRAAGNKSDPRKRDTKFALHRDLVPIDPATRPNVECRQRRCPSTRVALANAPSPRVLPIFWSAAMLPTK
jgi:hypothetical protein